MNNSPDYALMQKYGTGEVYEAKLAGLPWWGRLMWGAAVAQNAASNDAESAMRRSEAEQMNLQLRMLETARMYPTTGALQHSRVPMMLGAGVPMQGDMPFNMGSVAPSGPRMMQGSDVPAGYDEGMVRMASVMQKAAAVMAQRDVEMAKEAILGLSGLGSLAKGAVGAIKGLATRVPAAAVKGPGRIVAAGSMPLAKPLVGTIDASRAMGIAPSVSSGKTVAQAAQGVKPPTVGANTAMGIMPASPPRTRVAQPAAQVAAPAQKAAPAAAVQPNAQQTKSVAAQPPKVQQPQQAGQPAQQQAPTSTAAPPAAANAQVVQQTPPPVPSLAPPSTTTAPAGTVTPPPTPPPPPPDAKPAVATVQPPGPTSVGMVAGPGGKTPLYSGNLQPNRPSVLPPADGGGKDKPGFLANFKRKATIGGAAAGLGALYLGGKTLDLAKSGVETLGSEPRPTPYGTQFGAAPMAVGSGGYSTYN